MPTSVGSSPDGAEADIKLVAAVIISLIEGTPDRLPAVALGSNSTPSVRSPSLGREMAVQHSTPDAKSPSATQIVRELRERNIERLREIADARSRRR